MRRTTFGAALLALALPVLAEEISYNKPSEESATPSAFRIDANKSYLIPALEIIAFDSLLNLYDRHHYEGSDFDSNARTIRRNLRSSWVVDRDPFLVNQLGHPYQGSMYHGFARASGLNFWESLAFTFVSSAAWEVAGETTPPSLNDQINTGIGGAFFGEALFRMANLVLEKGNPPGYTREILAAMISPPVGINRAAFGQRFRTIYPSLDAPYFTRLQIGFSGNSGNGSLSDTKLKRGELQGDFFMDYGLPGQKGYEYERPFDYFSFQATASSANGFENVMTRGLLKGRSYSAGEKYRGVLGLYGSYDYIAPQTYRVSSTAVSLGTTGQYWLSEKNSLQGTALWGIGYTAAGSTRSIDDRDFNYGATPQALLNLRYIYGDRYCIDATGREYYISRLGAADRGGKENIVRLDLAFTYRVHGPHGITVKYLGNRRDVNYPDTGDATQRRQSIGLFYTLLGERDFGAVEWR
jgi:Domain of unknown function (DUF3943)